ncbi:MAG: thioredoxin domain-containing protein [Verrucomicrobiota bacterium]
MANALAHEKSPYLLQHADNPVAWLPWGEVAFAKARAEQKPIFLSIGYSTCHWCHVMAHESFENAAIAEILNEHFVPVKVDREERPDVDKVYMAYVQAMTGHGGWPLSAWLTPELKPFYGGTYFPPEDRHGRAGFPSLLRAITNGWANERDKLVAEGDRVIGVLTEYHQSKADGGEAAEGALVEVAGKAFEKGFEYFYENFDATNGGFGGAPKFPRASNLAFLFRVAALQGVDSDMGKEAVRLASATLRAMARGGIHDHLGGGFHRYSVDEGWFVPHFEKMLYDQAQIAMNCLEAKQATGDERFAWLARDIFEYVLRDLTSPQGGFYTAEDADSLVAYGGKEHLEGAFYVWTADELRAALATSGEVTPPDREAEEDAWRGGEEDYGLVAAHFDVKPEGNVPAQLDPQGELREKNILVQRRGLMDTARAAGLSPEQANDKLLAVTRHLCAVREKRPRPHLDDKILTANNGLMISALAKGAQVLGADGGKEEQARLLTAAGRAAEFLEKELYDAERGVLFRTWREGRGSTPGFAEDYAFLIQGLLDLYEAAFEIRWLQWAVRLQETMDALFWDGAGGGYFNSGEGDASIVLRLKEDYDGAEPAPSSVAAMNLLRLAAVFDGKGYRERGRVCIEAFRGQWAQAAHAMPQMLCALELALEPPRHVVLAGDPQAADFQALAAVLHERLGPRRMLLAADGGEGQRWLAQQASWLAEMTPREGRATAYVCEEYACQAPVTDPAELRKRLG